MSGRAAPRVEERSVKSDASELIKHVCFPAVKRFCARVRLSGLKLNGGSFLHDSYHENRLRSMLHIGLFLEPVGV